MVSRVWLEPFPKCVVVDRNFFQSVNSLIEAKMFNRRKQSVPECHLLNFYSANSEGTLSPKKSIKQNKLKVSNWWSKRYFDTLLFPLFHSCTLWQIRLPWNKLILNQARNFNYSQTDNKGKEFACISIERTIKRQFIRVIEKRIGELPWFTSQMNLTQMLKFTNGLKFATFQV